MLLIISLLYIFTNIISLINLIISFNTDKNSTLKTGNVKIIRYVIFASEVFKKQSEKKKSNFFLSQIIPENKNLFLPYIKNSAFMPYKLKIRNNRKKRNFLFYIRIFFFHLNFSFSNSFKSEKKTGMKIKIKLK